MSALDKIRQFACKHPNWFMKFLFCCAPLEVEQFGRFFPWLDLKLLRFNKKLYWSMELFLKYKDAMGFYYLPDPENGTCPWWIPELFEKHPEYYPIDWIVSEGNSFWEWNQESIKHWAPLIEQFPPYWDDDDQRFYNEAWIALCENSNVQWTPEMLKHYQDHIVWDYLSRGIGLSWTEAEIMPFENRWDWSTLARNKYIIWSKNMLKRHSDAIDWFFFSEEAKTLADPDIFITYEDKIDWRNIYANPHVRWDLGLIERYWDRLDWSLLCNSKNPYIPWSEELIEEHKELIPIRLLSSNPHPGIPWSENFILKHLGKWNLHGLINNPAIPWSERLIEIFRQREGDAVFWNGLFLRSTTTHWSVELIEKYLDKWMPEFPHQWSYLMENPSVPWDHDMLLHFADIITEREGTLKSFSIHSKDFWERLFAPYLDQAQMISILEDITPSLPTINT